MIFSTGIIKNIRRQIKKYSNQIQVQQQINHNIQLFNLKDCFLLANILKKSKNKDIIITNKDVILARIIQINKLELISRKDIKILSILMDQINHKHNDQLFNQIDNISTQNLRFLKSNEIYYLMKYLIRSNNESKFLSLIEHELFRGTQFQYSEILHKYFNIKTLDENIINNIKKFITKAYLSDFFNQKTVRYVKELDFSLYQYICLLHRLDKYSKDKANLMKVIEYKIIKQFELMYINKNAKESKKLFYKLAKIINQNEFFKQMYINFLSLNLYHLNLRFLNQAVKVIVKKQSDLYKIDNNQLQYLNRCIIYNVEKKLFQSSNLQYQCNCLQFYIQHNPQSQELTSKYLNFIQEQYDFKDPSQNLSLLKLAIFIIQKNNDHDQIIFLLLKIQSNQSINFTIRQLILQLLLIQKQTVDFNDLKININLLIEKILSQSINQFSQNKIRNLLKAIVIFQKQDLVQNQQIHRNIRILEDFCLKFTADRYQNFSIKQLEQILNIIQKLRNPFIHFDDPDHLYEQNIIEELRSYIDANLYRFSIKFQKKWEKNFSQI